MSSFNLNWNITDYESRSEELNNILDTNSNWTSIPTINSQPLHSLVNGSLVRFQGMVQDDLPKEFFYSTFSIKDKTTGELKTMSGRFKDVFDFSETEEIITEESPSHEVRNVLFCVPIPGLNTWTREPVKLRENAQNNEASSGVKRPHEEEGDEMEVNDNTKRISKDKVESEPTDAVAYNLDSYFPLPERGGLACIVKHSEEEEILINTRIEVVGFLSASPALEASWEGSDREDKAHNPPPSLVPRIHAIRIRKLKHNNPLLPLTPGYEGLNFQEIRSDLHTVLTQLLFGDTLAADYVICNLLSTVYARRDCLTVGSFSLNICIGSAVQDYPKMLFKFLQNLLPSSTYLPLTIDIMNTASFAPRKDYETNRLWSGRLQLSEDTHLLIDETVLSAGTLGQAGLQNIAILQSLSDQQTIPYNFSYYKIDFNTNIPVLILSEGKSLITTDAVLKLSPAEGTESSIVETFEAANFFLSGARLEAVRKYLTIARLHQCHMNNTDFVGVELASLREEYDQLQHKDIHRLLVLARVLGSSEGKTALSKSDWDRAVVMERERRSRLTASAVS